MLCSFHPRGQIGNSLRSNDAYMIAWNAITLPRLALSLLDLPLGVLLFPATPASSLAAKTQKSPVVIIHGAFGGSWTEARRSTAAKPRSHRLPPHFDGTGERSHLASLEISLRTHIQDVVNVIRFELSNVVGGQLLGHGRHGHGRKSPVVERVRFLDAAIPGRRGELCKLQ